MAKRTTATFKLHELANGTRVVKTQTRWYRSFGKCNLQHFSKQGEIYTRARFKTWAKKYGLELTTEEAEYLPTSVWWQ